MQSLTKQHHNLDKDDRSSFERFSLKNEGDEKESEWYQF